MKLLQRKTMKVFIAAIVALGIIRFVLSVSGLPDSIVTYSSMSVAIFAGAIYFALTTDGHLERLKAAYLLLIPYMFIEVAALSYTWASGRQTIFQSDGHNLGYPIAEHTIGHFVGGLTWEPLSVFVLMELVWLISRLFRK